MTTNLPADFFRHDGRIVELFGRSYTWSWANGWRLVKDAPEVEAARRELIGAVLDLQARVTSS